MEEIHCALLSVLSSHCMFYISCACPKTACSSRSRILASYDSIPRSFNSCLISSIHVLVRKKSCAVVFHSNPLLSSLKRFQSQDFLFMLRKLMCRIRTRSSVFEDATCALMGDVPSVSSLVVAVVVLLCIPHRARYISLLPYPIFHGRAGTEVLQSPSVVELVQRVGVVWLHSPIESR